MENTIEFKGPFNINHLDNHLEQKLKNPGIYIWGFMVDSKYNPIDCKNKPVFASEEMHFLPYYVGKKEDSIFTRLKQHKNVRNNDASKYMRISKPFLSLFFKDEFPIHYDGDKKYSNKLMIYNLNNNNKAISYFNNPMFMFLSYETKLKSKLNELFNLHNPKELPITLEIFKDCNIIDPLNEIVNNKFNFWFCYAEYNLEANNTNKKMIYEDLESLTYFSLKGKTISKVKEWTEDKKRFTIKDLTESNIFKDEPSTEFPGY
jgi:hypothetical protein